MTSESRMIDVYLLRTNLYIDVMDPYSGQPSYINSVHIEVQRMPITLNYAYWRVRNVDFKT